jgi:alpha-ribazole phosphatase
MEIYLIRHTRPNINRDTCYGQADIDVVESFHEEAKCIREYLPEHIEKVYSSPLKRCRQLAEHLFPEHHIHFDDRLKEINCGDWELKLWNDIDQDLLKQWMADFANVVIPGGESYTQLYERAKAFFNSLYMGPKSVAIVSHGGVIRSILSFIENVALMDSFKTFSLFYGCVVRVEVREDKWGHTVLYNRKPLGW